MIPSFLLLDLFFSWNINSLVTRKLLWHLKNTVNLSKSFKWLYVLMDLSGIILLSQKILLGSCFDHFEPFPLSFIEKLWGFLRVLWRIYSYVSHSWFKITSSWHSANTYIKEHSCWRADKLTLKCKVRDGFYKLMMLMDSMKVVMITHILLISES